MQPPRHWLLDDYDDCTHSLLNDRFEGRSHKIANPSLMCLRCTLSLQTRHRYVPLLRYNYLSARTQCELCKLGH